MFTGIIEEIGRIESVSSTKDGIRLSIGAQIFKSGVKVGDSIAVNGICLTVAALKKDIVSFDCMPQTLKNTSLVSVKKGADVNLERSLKLGDRVSGHFVYGHIDCVSPILDISRGADGVTIAISMSGIDARYILDKGSVVLDGVSLTVGQVRQGQFSVYLIPHTLKVTTLSGKKRGDLLNIEFDMLAKYAEGPARNDRVIDEDFLKENGFL